LDDYPSGAADPASWRHAAAVGVVVLTLAVAAIGSRSPRASGFLVGALLGAIVAAPFAVAHALGASLP